MYCVYSIIHVASITADREARDTVMKNRKILKLRCEIAMAVYLDSFTIQTIVVLLSLLVYYQSNQSAVLPFNLHSGLTTCSECNVTV